MRIGQRQESQNAVTMENLTSNGIVRFFGADSGDQRMVPIIPKCQWNIGFLP